MLTMTFIRFKKSFIVVLEEGWKYSFVPKRNALANIRQIENVTCEKLLTSFSYFVKCFGKNLVKLCLCH